MPVPFRIVAAQASAGLVLAVFLLSVDAAFAAAAAMAAAVIVVPNGMFAWRVEGRSTASMRRNPEAQARRLLGQGVAKLLATVALMVVVFARWAPAPWPFFGTLVVLQGLHWVIPLVSGPPRSRATPG